MDSNQLQRKNIRGKYDNSPTPPELYRIILEAGFTDVCNADNAFLREWAEKSYCNPPFSLKNPFVRKAIEESRKHKKVLLYLPLDPTTSWFRQLHDSNVIVFILMKKWRNRWPTALYYLSNFSRPSVVFAELDELEVLLND